MQIDVSIVFVQYNPVYIKVMRSLYSLISQKGIDFEIVVVDDGSKEDYFDRIKCFFIKNGFSNYILHKNPNNLGTVKNYLSGIKLASGKFIFGNSPGDILAYDYALKDYYTFAIKHHSKCLFAEAIYYRTKNSSVEVFSTDSNPPKPQMHNWYLPKIFGKYSLFCGNCILGSVFLRQKEYAEKYILAISETAKYVEDNTSALLIVMDGERITFFNKAILWYETGSTRPKEVEEWWEFAMKEDFNNTHELIQEKYASDPMFDFTDLRKNRYERVLKHPLLFSIKTIYNKAFSKKTTIASKEVEEKLNSYFGFIDKMTSEEWEG